MCVTFTSNSHTLWILKFGIKILQLQIFLSIAGKLSTASPETEERAAAEANLVSMNGAFNDFLDMMIQHMVYAINILLARHKKRLRPSINKK